MSTTPPPGRPTEWTPEIQQLICDAIRVGTPRKHAAISAGISERSLYVWLQKGRAGLDPYRQFLQAVEKADADCVAMALGRVALAAQKPQHWTAAAWLLERKHPAEFGQRVRLVVEEQLNGFLDKLQSRLPPDVFRQVLDAASDGSGGSETDRALAAGGEAEVERAEEDPSIGGLDPDGVIGLPESDAP